MGDSASIEQQSAVQHTFEPKENALSLTALEKQIVAEIVGG